MKTLYQKFSTSVAYFFILLFVYASISKVLDFENFQVQIGQSPLLSGFAGIISYSVITIEILVAIILSFREKRLFGLYCSLFLMSAFTVYIFLILNYSEFIPCSCGGILENMSWTQHLIFNVFAVIIATSSIVFDEKKKKKSAKTYFSNISCVMLLSSGLVIALYFTSNNIIKEENNFTRRFFPNALIEINRLTLDHQFYYFAGYDHEKIYLGNVTSPLRPKIIKTDLTSTSIFKIKITDLNYNFRNLKLQIHSPYYYLYDGSVPIIYRGKLNHPNPKTISYKDAYFDQLAVMDSTHFAIRALSGKTKALSLGKIALTPNKLKVNLFPNILKKQVDGVFDSDGLLLSQPKDNQVIYTYAYRNQIIIMNQKMEILKIQNTIDTTAVAHLQIRKLSNGSYKMNAPPYKVNKIQSVYEDLVLNQSNLMGKFESAKKWENSSIVDIYNIRSNEYIGSFYVPHHDKKKMTQMLMVGRKFYVLIGNQIIAYELRITLLKAMKIGNAENLTE